MPRRPGSDSGLRPPTAVPDVLLARDHNRGALDRRLRSQSVVRLSRGVYVAGPDGGSARDRALASIVGTHRRIAAEHVVSHLSAALVHGLRVWRLDPRVHVYQRSGPSSHADPAVVRHTPLPPAHDRTTAVHVPATTLERTAWDCLTTLPPADALVVADAALRAGVDRDALEARRRPGARGAARALAVLRFADDGAESPPESICRFRMLRAGLPVPTTQIEIDTRLGTFWGDLGWPEWRVVLEYDGRPKYDGPEALVAEKRRHDAVVEAGWRVLRITKEDLASGSQLLTRVLPLLPAELTRTRRPRGDLSW